MAIGSEANHGEIRAVGRPIGVLHVLLQRPWGATGDRQPRQPADANVAGSDLVGILEHEQIARRRNREQRGNRNAERAKPGCLHGTGEECHI